MSEGRKINAPLRLELLVGRVVHDSDGRRVGRIAELIAERKGAECFIREVQIAPSRFVALLWLVVSALGQHHDPDYVQVYWRDLDLGDWRRPVLRGRREALVHRTKKEG